MGSRYRRFICAILRVCELACTGLRRVKAPQSVFVLIGTVAVDVSRHWAGLGNWIVTVNSMDRRHFGLITTNFEHHGPTISSRGYDRGFRDGVAGHLRGSACGFGRDLRDGRGHAAKSKSQPTRSLARLPLIHGSPIGLQRERCSDRVEGADIFKQAGHLPKLDIPKVDLSQRACGRRGGCAARRSSLAFPAALRRCVCRKRTLTRSREPVKELVESPPEECGPCQRCNRADAKN